MADLEYLIDEQDIIREVNEGWDLFADSNGSPEAFSKEVIGHSIYDFITDEPTRALYRDIYAEIREQKLALDFTFRCDSPDIKRLFLMEIIPQDRGRILIRTQLLEEEHTGQPNLEFACVNAPVSIPRCSVCGRVRWQGVMVSPAMAMNSGLTLDGGSALQVFYMVCEDCRSNLRQRMLAISQPQGDRTEV